MDNTQFRFQSRDANQDVPASMQIIKRAREIRKRYSDVKSSLERLFAGELPDEPIPPNSPLIAAYLVSLEDMFQEFSIGKRSGLELIMILCARSSREYPDLGAVWEVFAELRRPGAADGGGAILVNEISLPALIATADVDAADFCGLVVTAAVRYGQDIGKLKLAASWPEIMDAITTSASIPGREGHADRKLAAEMAGMITTKQEAPTINITNKMGIIGGMPQWDGDRKAVEDILLNTEQKQ